MAVSITANPAIKGGEIGSLLGKHDVIPLAKDLDSWSLGDGKMAYNWKPQDGTSSPYFDIQPNPGYHFAGFEVHEEIKEKQQDEQGQEFFKTTPRDFRAITNFEMKDMRYVVKDPESISWNDKLMVYDAKFNKNIYNVIVENWFYDENNVKLTSVKSDDVKGIKAVITDKARNPIEMFDLRSTGVTTDAAKSVFTPTSISNGSSIANYIKGRLEFSFDNNGQGNIFTAHSNLRASGYYCIDDVFSVKIEKTQTVERYQFMGWYYKVKSNANPNYIEPIPTVFNKENQDNKNPDLRDVYLNRSFLENKKDYYGTGDPKPPTPIPPANEFQSDQITIVAKWKMVPWSLVVSSGQGGTVTADNKVNNWTPAV